MIQYPIESTEELYENMAEIHRAITDTTDDPSIPILVERDLELELAFQQQEFYMENFTNNDFPGITNTDLIAVVVSTVNLNRTIADVNPKPDFTIKPPIQKHQSTLKPIVEHMLDKIKKVA